MKLYSMKKINLWFLDITQQPRRVLDSVVSNWPRNSDQEKTLLDKKAFWARPGLNKV